MFDEGTHTRCTMISPNTTPILSGAGTRSTTIAGESTPQNRVPSKEAYVSRYAVKVWGSVSRAQTSAAPRCSGEELRTLTRTRNSVPTPCNIRVVLHIGSVLSLCLVDHVKTLSPH